MPLVVVAAFFACVGAVGGKATVRAAEFGDEPSLGITGVYFNPPSTFEFNAVKSYTNGMYIYRDMDVINDVRKFAPNAPFSGSVMIPDNMVNQISPYYEFTPVINVAGNWYDSTQYADAFGQFALQGTSLADWFHIYTDTDMDDNIIYTNICDWEMPINSPAGKYGIRARVMEDVGGWHPVTGVRISDFQPRPEKMGNYIVSPYDDYYFAILYGEDVNEIRLFDERGEQSSVKNIGEDGRQTTIRVATNTGAMRYDTKAGNGAHYTNIPHIQYGALDMGQELYWNKDSAALSVTYNGMPTKALDLEWEGSTIKVSIPSGAPEGKYVITVNHNVYKPDLFGTYTIINGSEKFNQINASTVGGIVMIVIGLVGVLGGSGLVLGPRIAYAINALRYKHIDDKVYGNDAASVRKREKEKKALEEKIKKGEIKKSDIEKKEGKGFQERLGEYRTMREEAKKQGISVQEYREILRQQGYNLSKTQGGLATARKIMGDQVVMTENIDTENVAAKIKDTNLDEFTILDTVKRDTLVKTDQFATVKQEVREEAVSPIAPVQKGILGRITRALGEDTKLEKMDKDGVPEDKESPETPETPENNG